MIKHPLKRSSQFSKSSEYQPSDTDYLYIDEEQEISEYEPPSKTEITEAIYNKYIRNQIKEEQDQGEEGLTSSKSELPGQYRFKIKNLDTGEQEEIQTEQDEQIITGKIIKNVHKIQQSNSWRNFWVNVEKNNESLRSYCQSGMYDQVKGLLVEGRNGYPVEINCKGLDNWRPIHYASYQGNGDIVQLLIDNGAEMNVLQQYNRNPLHLAAIKGSLEVVEVLCKRKIAINQFDNEGNTPLHLACQNGYAMIVKYLLSLGCSIVRNKQGKTPIQQCADQQLKQLFIQAGYSQKGDYNSCNTNQEKKMIMVQNHGQSITPQDFIYYKLLGKGSFGQVFLVRKKDDQKKQFYAMKVLSKEKIFGKSLNKYALTERKVMSIINHPFMVKLYYAFQTQSQLFLVMQYYPGGDLGKLITRRKKIPQIQARNYIAQLILAFQALHKNMIVFRDLKPQNVVLDQEGHCKLTDFGLSKQGIYNNMTSSFCGSIAYLAPEILGHQGHSRTVDWYLVGLLLYELIVGLPPYYNSKKEVMFDNIKRGALKIPKDMSAQARDLIKQLLCRDPKRRLGSVRDSQQLKSHILFAGVNWQDVYYRKIVMPAVEVPKINENQLMKNPFYSRTSNSGKNKQGGGDGKKNGKLDGWTFVNQEGLRKK